MSLLNESLLDVRTKNANNLSDEQFAQILSYDPVLNGIDVKDIPGITYYQTDNFEIEFLDAPKSSWCIDGEEYKDVKTTFKFEVNQESRMMIPNENIGKLFED